MTYRVTRRSFLGKSVATGAALGLATADSAAQAEAANAANDASVAGMPVARIKDVTVSRLICGGNLMNHWMHPRDLPYLNVLARHYNTEEKILDTLELCEELGINTVENRWDNRIAAILQRYRKQRGGTIQYFVRIWGPPGDRVPNRPTALHEIISKAIDSGATALFVHGCYTDQCVLGGRIDKLHELLGLLQDTGLPAGIAAHALPSIKRCEEEGMEPDFYVKTFHHDRYWSAHPQQFRDEYGEIKGKHNEHHLGHDNMWCPSAEDVIEYMHDIKRPWIAYKVLAAGAIHPQDGFKFAFRNGADFIDVGMFDFQVRENAALIRQLFKDGRMQRPRAWMA